MNNDDDRLKLDSKSPAHESVNGNSQLGGRSQESRIGKRRAKYATLACDECRRRKLRCLDVDSQEACQRCIAGNVECSRSTRRERRMTRAATRTTPVEKTSDHRVGHENHGEDQISSVRALSQQVARLNETVADLLSTTKKISQPSTSDDVPGLRHLLPTVASPGNIRQQYSPATTSESRKASVQNAPRQPQFVGPTRSAYTIEIGQQSLTRMGVPVFRSPWPSRPQSPNGTLPSDSSSVTEFWSECTVEEIGRLLDVFYEEVVTVYPVVDNHMLKRNAANILRSGRKNAEYGPYGSDSDEVGDATFSEQDFHIAKVAIATSLVIEAHGTNKITKSMIEPVDRHVSRISKPIGNLRELQLLALLSLYYFYCDEDLLAWRAVGFAARGALELGLHRKSSLESTFPDSLQQQEALQVFWCIYALDRRWSFGTSLSFALADRDIDPGLPELGPGHDYLRCTIHYGRLSSSLWEAIVSCGPSHDTISDETAEKLDVQTQEWLDSIPHEYRLRHPRLGLAPRAQPLVLHRLRALLYLRANHTRLLIYRHHLLSQASMRANLEKSSLVVEIAKDSLQVLEHLHATSDIYARQQNGFNYFLVAAVAAIFLAVCHEPSVFAESCRRTFHAAVRLVHDLSRHSRASRRLWGSIRGLLPRLRRLGMREDDEEGESTDLSHNSQDEDSRRLLQHPDDTAVSMENRTEEVPMNIDHPMPATNTDGLTPDMSQMSNDLMELFHIFDQSQQIPVQPQAIFIHDHANEVGETTGLYGVPTLTHDEISRLFQGLL